MVENSSQLELLHRTNLLKFSEVAVEKTEGFGNLINPKLCTLSCGFLIWCKDHLVLISWHLDQVCRTNLFKFPDDAVKKIHVLRALTTSIFDVLLGVIIIYDIEPLVIISSQKDKVCRTNLFQVWIVAVKEFYVFRVLNNSKLDALLCVVLI